jgi:hypothetical protein
MNVTVNVKSFYIIYAAQSVMVKVYSHNILLGNSKFSFHGSYVSNISYGKNTSNFESNFWNVMVLNC